MSAALVVAFVSGVATLAVLLLQPGEAWAGLLAAGMFVVQMALGGVLLFAVQTACGATWWRSFRVESLNLGRALPVGLALVAMCLVAGHETLYPWARGDFHAGVGKRVWLNVPMVLARALVIGLVWLAFWAALRRAAAENRPALGRWAVAFLPAYVVTQTVAAWDWLMSTEPAWYSTVYSVYVFGGTLVAGIAALTVRMMWRREDGLTASQRHDLGKLLFAFSTFWAYLWFCQFLLIWYSNMPEETGHYARRLAADWGPLFWLNPILSFVLPFTLLLSSAAKRNRAVLLRVALLVLVGRWLDLYLLVAPTLGSAPGTVSALAPVVGAVALLLAATGPRVLESEPRVRDDAGSPRRLGEAVT
jgi:hypothetical protein